MAERTSQAQYQTRRGEIETYFDRTAVDAWAKLTSTAPVGHIRTTVRAGRDQMRATLMGWLPQDLHGARVLDAGCGTGALSVLTAARGAEVVAIDLSPTLVKLAEERMPSPSELNGGSIRFLSGDMLDPKLGRFDYVVCMDSVIHYCEADAVRVLSGLAERTQHSILFTFAPKTPLLATMRAMGRLLPRSNRAPWIEPVGVNNLYRLLGKDAVLKDWNPARTYRVKSGFYTSQAMELTRS